MCNCMQFRDFTIYFKIMDSEQLPGGIFEDVGLGWKSTPPVTFHPLGNTALKEKKEKFFDWLYNVGLVTP